MARVKQVARFMLDKDGKVVRAPPAPCQSPSLRNAPAVVPSIKKPKNKAQTKDSN
jgi:hypothetical protein